MGKTSSKPSPQLTCKFCSSHLQLVGQLANAFKPTDMSDKRKTMQAIISVNAFMLRTNFIAYTRNVKSAKKINKSVNFFCVVSVVSLHIQHICLK